MWKKEWWNSLWVYIKQSLRTIVKWEKQSVHDMWQRWKQRGRGICNCTQRISMDGHTGN